MRPEFFGRELLRGLREPRRSHALCMLVLGVMQLGRELRGLRGLRELRGLVRSGRTGRAG